MASAAIASMLIGSATVASATHVVEVGDSATLLAKGAGLVVPVEVTCDPNQLPPFPFPPFPSPSPSVSVQVTQRSGNRIVQGFGYAPATCTGTPQTVNVQLTAQQAPFKHGTALATATVFMCDSTGCHSASDTEEIRIKN
ncbi:MAG: hypothetical protein LC799_24780 [Actinobacteria bacterium]|nr:hypothetical protein [Actinomycetota bacterium]